PPRLDIFRFRCWLATQTQLHHCGLPVRFLRERAYIFFFMSQAGGAMAIFGAPVSISISQMGYFLAISGWALWSWLGPRTEAERLRLGGPMLRTWSMPFEFPLVLKLAVALYGVLALSLLVNS